MPSFKKSVVELNLRARFGLNIIAIEHNGQVIEHVDPKLPLLPPGDIFDPVRQQGKSFPI